MPLDHVIRELSSKQEVSLTKKEFVDGLLDWLKQGAIAKAADAYLRVNEDVGYALLEAVGKGRLARPLAEMFLKARDLYKAGQVYETLGLINEAARTYEQAEVYPSAAEMYGQLGEMAKCAEMLERAGSYRQAGDFFARANAWENAGRNYEKSHEIFLAGRSYLQAGQERKALELLQKVGVKDLNYVEAVSLLGPVLTRMGFGELALQKYLQVTNQPGADQRILPIYYLMARLYEDLNRTPEALETYSKVLAFDLNYQDAQSRYLALKKRGAVEKVPPDRLQGRQLEDPHSDVVILNEEASVLDKTSLFKHLSREEIRIVLALAQKIPFKEAEWIHREGMEARGILIFVKGKIAVSFNLNGQNVTVAHFGPGAHFGELSVLGPQKTHATLQAKNEGTYLLFPTDRLQALLARSPSLTVKVLRNIIEALDEHLAENREILKSMWSHRSRLNATQEEHEGT